MTWVLYLPPGETADIPRRHHWFFPRNDIWETSAEIPYWWRVTPEIWVVLLICRATYSREFVPTNQKHYPDLESDASSVWNFCCRFSDVISRANPWWPRDMSAVFSGHGNVQDLLKVKPYVYQPCGLIKSRLFSTLCSDKISDKIIRLLMFLQIDLLHCMVWLVPSPLSCLFF